MSLLQPQPRWTDVAKALNRFKKQELLNVPENLESIFDVTDPLFDNECRPDKKSPKYDVVAGYIRHLKRNTDTWSALSHLCLLDTKCRSSRRVWKIFRGDQARAQEDDLGRSPEEVAEQLEEELSRTNKSQIAVQLHDGAYWIHVATKSKRAQANSKASVIYIVHYAYTSCFASVSMAVKLQEILCRAMEAIFGLANVALTALQDRNLDSLFQLQHCTKFPERYLERGMENPPSMEEEPISDYDPRIVDLQAEEKAERNRAFKRKFGWEKAPPITKLTYQLHTAFGGLNHVPQLRDNPAAVMMETKVVFEGSDVLNGIQQMVRSGMTTGPLPKHLTDVRTLGRTHFSLRPRASNVP